MRATAPSAGHTTPHAENGAPDGGCHARRTVSPGANGSVAVAWTPEAVIVASSSFTAPPGALTETFAGSPGPPR